MSESKHATDECAGNVKVTVSEKEVRVWVCDEKGCQFRFKAMGKVVKSGGMDVMVVAKSNSHDALLKACKNSPSQKFFADFALLAESFSQKPTLAIYKPRFIALATFLRSCESRATKMEAVIAEAKGEPGE